MPRPRRGERMELLEHARASISGRLHVLSSVFLRVTSSSSNLNMLKALARMKQPAANFAVCYSSPTQHEKRGIPGSSNMCKIIGWKVQVYLPEASCPKLCPQNKLGPAVSFIRSLGTMGCKQHAAQDLRLHAQPATS